MPAFFANKNFFTAHIINADFHKNYKTVKTKYKTERRSTMFKHLRITAVLLAAALLDTFAAAGYYSFNLSDSYYISSGSDLELSTFLPITADTSKENSLAAFYQNPSGSCTASLKLFGVIPVKTADIQEIDTPMLIPGGEPFGIRLRMDGVMVIRLSSADTKDGSICPAKEAGLCAGDIIESVDGSIVTSNASLKDAICKANGDEVKIEFTRDGKQKSCQLTPAYSLSEDCYTAGIWVRDSLAGIGTMTFYDPESMTFGGLGHPICDSDTGVCIPISEGSACPVEIKDIIKGTKGEPGMLEGAFCGNNDTGSLLCNNRCGVFGKMSAACPEKEAVPMAFKQEIETGKAEIICTIDGGEPAYYSAEIEDIDQTGKDNTKNMIIHITDERLLNATGGIVQGMSGSPIIQNGKLIGAVTHVFVDDPTRGYGIFCENMYRYGTI